ncbi:MAG: hypothetical protein OWR62_02725 [Sulfobacillus thermotolerans]|uniref:Uncharacterized protein n=1 Tax=Sulfobacillus thermotolerans TaxID=338644 RepID=A0ABN5GYT7_9FIRM|nr:hypothetical protein BXT84_01880 [Sulfobacillus thermotolerans]MCY0907284.1 hypothetical protein [Sulfobacillus thermotolerans]
MEHPSQHHKDMWDPIESETVPPANDKLPEGAHRTPPKGYPVDRSAYAIPQWYALPIDTPEHARNAASRFPQMDVYQVLSEEDRRIIWQRIVQAERRFGIEPGPDVLRRAGYEG